MNRMVMVPLLLLSTVQPLNGQQFPPVVPPPEPVAAMRLPKPQEELLPNGLRLVVYEDHRAPVVSIALALNAGNAYDPPGKEGLSDLLASLLTRGAGQLSGDSVAALLERVGASFGVVSGADHLTLQFDAPSSEAATGFSVIGNAVQHPVLDSAEFAVRRGERVKAVNGTLEDPQTLAGRVFLLTSYSDHPYGSRPGPASLLSISADDLRTFMAARVRPNGAVLVVAGDISLAEASRMARGEFGGWKGSRPAGLPAQGPRRAASSVMLVHLPGATEATILIGGTALEGADSGHYAAAVLTRLLSDPAAGRLARAFQAKPEWPSETGASLTRTAGVGLIQVTATVPVEIADSALRTLRREAAAVGSGAIGEAEFARAREYVAGTFALRLQSAAQLAAAEAETHLLGLPPSYLVNYRPNVMAVTTSQVRAIAKRVLPESGQVTVVAGDAVKLHARLAKLGPVQLIGLDGRRLDLAAIQPHAVPFALDMGRFAPRLDSLAIVAQGRVLGGQVITVLRQGDSLNYRDESVFADATRQLTTATLDTLGRPSRTIQRGSTRGGKTEISLLFGEGRVTGSVEFTGADSQSVVRIDQPVPGDVVDESALAALLPLLRWELNNQWSLNVFSAREKRISTMTLTVADIAPVTVPAGVFDCFRGDLEGGPRRLSFFVTRSAPYRIVRIEIANTPVELVAINP
jgi:zinc protease